MNVKCGLESHEWRGCKCATCGQTRDQDHDWTPLKKIGPMVRSRTCQRCGKEDRSVIIDPSDPDDLDAFMRTFMGR